MTPEAEGVKRTSAAKYRTIVVDPPWAYPEGFASTLGRPHLQDRQRGVTTSGPVVSRPLPYRSMTLEEIRALPIRSLADTDARLFLWTTSRYIIEAVDIMREWGFRYRQIIVWDKTPNIPPFGGSIAPNTAEFLLVATIGAPIRKSRWSSSVVRTRKARSEHSRKPDVFLDMAEAVSPGPYVELFARRQRLGWDTWGDEALDHLEMEA